EDYMVMCNNENIEPVGVIRVMRYEELVEYAMQKFGLEYFNDLIRETMMHPEWDVREKSMQITDILLLNCQEMTPAIVIMFAPPYYPAVNSSEDELVQRCVAQIKQNAIAKFDHEL